MFAKLKDPHTRHSINTLLVVAGLLCPDQYRLYLLGAAAVLSVLGLALPNKLQQQVDALTGPVD